MADEITREWVRDYMTEVLKECLGSVAGEFKEQNEALYQRLSERQGQPAVIAAAQGGGAAPGYEPTEKGMFFGRYVMCLALAKGHRAEAARIAAQKFGPEDPVTKAMAAGDATAGGSWIQPGYSDEVIELLRAQSVVMSLNPILINMETGTVAIPKITGGSTAYYKAENSDGTTSALTSGDVNLVARELMALVPVGNQLLQFARNADQIIRDDMVSAVAVRGDQAFIRGDGAANTPRGLRYQAAADNIVAANGTVNLANTTTDLGKCMLGLKNANSRMIRPGWIMAPRTEIYLSTVRDGNGNAVFRGEMAEGKLFGFPFKSTTNVPITLSANQSELYLVDFADVVVGETGGIAVEVFDQGTYVVGGTTYSTVQRNETLVRALVQHDIGVRHDGSVFVLNEVTWGA